jgi:ABC-type glycerol-3-phosphate transport system substrate-binding protein
MNKTSSTFQIVLIGVFIFAAVVGVLVFSAYTNSSNNSAAKATIWGTETSDDFTNLLAIVDPQRKTMDIVYVQKSADTFEAEFVNALAEGTGPDIVLIDDSKLASWKGKLQPLSFTTLPQRTFTDTFVDASNVFMMPNGVYALPLNVDPLVMYWNKTMFSDAGIVLPPKTWQELTSEIPKLTNRTTKSEIIKSTVALGESSNIDHSKEILVNLLLQGGNSLIKFDPATSRYVSTVNNLSLSGVSVLGAVTDFYTSFSDPNNERYSWNKSLVSSRDAFVAGKLAVYFGYASEYPVLQRKNPNLNFDVSVMPQDESRPSDIQATSYAKINALALVKQSKNQAAAFAVMTQLIALNTQKELSKITNLPSARKDLLAIPNGTNSYADVFAKATIQSKTWLDPNPTATDSMFRELIDNITTGRFSSMDARNTLDQKFGALISGVSPSSLNSVGN